MALDWQSISLMIDYFLILAPNVLTNYFGRTYRYDIPVVRLNGQYLMKHRINEELLRMTLDTTKQ